MEKITIRWVTRDKEVIERIRLWFGISTYTTINGFSPAEIAKEDIPLLQDLEQRGFLQIRQEKWCKNGDEITFLF